MSSTRRQTKEGPLRQERFMSSRLLRRGLIGNAVARRTTAIKTAAERELVWFLQDLSHRDPAELHHTCNHINGWPWSSSEEESEGAFERLARELSQRADVRPSASAMD